MPRPHQRTQLTIRHLLSSQALSLLLACIGLVALLALLLSISLPADPGQAAGLSGRQRGLIGDRAAIYTAAEADRLRSLAVARLRHRLVAAAANGEALATGATTVRKALAKLLVAARYPTSLVYRPRPSSEAGADSSDSIARSRRDRVRSLLRKAWTSYAENAWGANELRPISRQGAGPGVGDSDLMGGTAPLGATLVDSLDSLWIAGLTEDFQRAADWTLNELSFDKDVVVSVFEMTIRFLGGLLSTFFLTGDPRFITKASQLADRLMPAFATPSGLPRALVNLKTGATSDHKWAPFGCSVLAEVGSLHMEFSLLSELTGNPAYAEAVRRVRKALARVPRPHDGLYPNFVHPGRPERVAVQVASLGSLGDSFYEYLLKEWIRTNRSDSESLRLFLDATVAIDRRLLRRSPGTGGFWYLAELRDGQPSSTRMEHLACFAGGMFALAAKSARSSESLMSKRWLLTAVELTRTCRETYARATSGLGPEVFQFDPGAEAVALRPEDKIYMLRPETVESYLYLWRVTGKQQYREWAWEAVLAIERLCMLPGGFVGISDVYAVRPPVRDLQPSYFLAETLKYLYLIFSDSAYYSGRLGV